MRSKNQYRCCRWVLASAGVARVCFHRRCRSFYRPCGDSRRYTWIIPGSQSLSSSELSSSRDCHHVHGKNYISVTQSDAGKELAEVKAIPSREPVSASPSQEGKEGSRNLCKRPLRCGLMATDMKGAPGSIFAKCGSCHFCAGTGPVMGLRSGCGTFLGGKNMMTVTIYMQTERHRGQPGL